MRKQTKVVAVASAAALLAIGGAMTSFAAQGWVEEDGTWYYYDKDGSRVEDEWKKSGDNWFWLDSEEGGAMATDKIIDDNDDTYYVDGNGVMVTNTWVKVVNEDQDDEDDPAEYHYYYMQSNGKAYKDKSTNGSLTKKVIDGKRYAFDEDGKMLYGWVAEDGDMCNGEDEWENATYYFGSWEDGSMKTGWQKITVYDDSTDKKDDFDYWFNFKSNGKKRAHSSDDLNDTWKSNGKYYHFDNRGVMVYEWYQIATQNGDQASASNWAYFNSPEDGARAIKGWFKVVAPTEDNKFSQLDDSTDTFATKNSRNEDEKWYYSDGKDEGLVTGEIKKIKGKYYAFAPDNGVDGGRMLSGLCALRMDGSTIVEVLKDEMDADDLDDFMDGTGDFAGMTYASEAQGSNNVYLYYFGDADDADSDGAMKVGNVTVNLDGDNYQFFFKKNGGAESRGRGINGIYDKKYVYRYGQKLKADSDEKYIVVYATDDYGTDTAVVKEIKSKDLRANQKDAGVNKDKDHVSYVGNAGAIWDSNYYLVNTSGNIQKSKTAAKDGDDWYFYLNDKNIVAYTNNKTVKDTVVENWKTWSGKTYHPDNNTVTTNN